MKQHNPNEEQDNSRLIMAILISVMILFGFNVFFEKPQLEKRQAQQEMRLAKIKTSAPVAVEETIKTRDEAIATSSRIIIDGKKVHGSISLKGARIDDLSLRDHKEKVGGDKNVPMLSPSGTKEAYYVESGWASDDKTVALPNNNTVWRLARESASTLTTGGEITLQWDNGEGLLFDRKIELDENYLFTITQKVTNKTSSQKQFNAWHLVSRHSLPVDYSGFFILHEGPLAFLQDKLQDPSYKNLDEGDHLDVEGTSGWIGITDKYWFVGLIPPVGEKFNARIIGNKTANKKTYQTDIVSPAQILAPGQTIEDKKFVFAGVKNLDLLMSYEKKYGFDHLDLTFDFGVLYFITKPLFFVMHFLIDFFGNVGLAIIAITFLIRGAVFPLANKSYRSMAGMKKLGPQLKEVQAKYKNDKQKMQMHLFDLYKKEGVNPFSGCWPMLVQIPIFFALYKVILISVELRHAPFWGWISDLSAPDPTNVFTLFGLIPWTPPSFLAIGVWPLLFCLTMVVQKRLSPPVPDKTQEQMQTYFPYFITLMLAQFASGLVIYWTWSNVLAVLQQYYILRNVGEEDVSLLRGHKQRRKPKKVKSVKDEPVDKNEK